MASGGAQAVRRSLGRRHLLRVVREIRQLHTKGNLLLMTLQTDGGAVKFQLDTPGEGCHSFGPAGLLLADAGGNYFHVPDRRKLPKRQRRLLDSYFGD